MAILRPFQALRPRPADAARVAAVPYDVVTTDEARAAADGNPLSFLRVSRPELELPAGTDPHGDEVYERAAANFQKLERTALVVEAKPSIYVYRLTSGAHDQTGIAGCFALDEYDRGIIKKHERTRRDKEDDRTRHMLTLAAQTGPVFLVYRASEAVETLVARATQGSPLFDFEAPDGVRHRVWQLPETPGEELAAAFGRIPALYIADGHHRAASAARARDQILQHEPGRPRSEAADCTMMLGVAFPHDQTQILSYNRLVKDLGPRTRDGFLAAVEQRFEMEPGPASPAGRGQIAMYLDGTWRTLRSRTPLDRSDPIRSLDVSVLQDQLLAPVLEIADIRTDPRIEFVGGARGASALERAVDSGKAAVAFSLFPVDISDLMAVSDAGDIMPPKSTWFEPKLRDGLLIHRI